MREGFKEIAGGWTLISGMDDITDRIERLAEWTKANGPLLPDEERTVELMIQTQIARGMENSGDGPLCNFCAEPLAACRCEGGGNDGTL